MSNQSISIIIPVLNQVEKLEQCLSKLQDQINNFNDIEILIVDNGSTDGSERLAEKYNFRTLCYSDMGGPYQARNKGAEECNGDVLVFLDAKCIPSEDYIFEIRQMLKGDDWDLVAGDFYFPVLNSESTLSELSYAVMNLRTNPKYNGGEVSTLTGNMMVRKNVFFELGKFDIKRSGGDVRFSQKASQYKKRKIFNGNLRVSYQAKGIKDLIQSLKRDAIDLTTSQPWYSIRPANIRYINERLNDLNIRISSFKKLRLMFFMMYLRFIKYYHQAK